MAGGEWRVERGWREKDRMGGREWDGRVEEEGKEEVKDGKGEQTGEELVYN